MTLTDQKKQALELYVNQSYTQQQIANALGVTVRTIHNWVKQHAWDRLRLATHQAPAIIADNFSSQLVELQNSIAAREPGKRIPTTQEMEIMRKLTVCIANTKKTVSLPQGGWMSKFFVPSSIGISTLCKAQNLRIVSYLKTFATKQKVERTEKLVRKI